MADIRVLVDQIEDILDQIKEVDRQQKRRIRQLESRRFGFPLPDLVPGSGEYIADDEDRKKKR